MPNDEIGARYDRVNFIGKFNLRKSYRDVSIDKYLAQCNINNMHPSNDD